MSSLSAFIAEEAAVADKDKTEPTPPDLPEWVVEELKGRSAAVDRGEVLTTEALEADMAAWRNERRMRRQER